MKKPSNQNNPLVFKVINLGCKVNLYESNSVQNDLSAAGYTKFINQKIVDIFVINTCTVTNKADSKSLLIIRRCLKANPQALIVVMGCYSQLNYETLKDLHLPIIIGNKYKNQIVDLIDDYRLTKKPIIKIDNLLLESQYEDIINDVFCDNTRAFIKIQDGCNFMCSYCTIPWSRGRQRSQNHLKILQEINKLVSNNYREVVLTGVNTAGYYETKNYQFYELLSDIDRLPGNFRVRISSLEPFQISPEIINLICNNPHRWCQHWHICLQSADNEILKKMNRKYYFEDFQRLINSIRILSPQTVFTTDLIVGFPFEKETNFQNSFDNIKKLNLFNAHIFRYSKRKNTLASILSQQVSEKTKTDRAKILENYFLLQQQIILTTFVGKTVQVIFEKSKFKNLQYGHSSQYFEVFVVTKLNLTNQWREIKIIKIIDCKAYGELV